MTGCAHDDRTAGMTGLVLSVKNHNRARGGAVGPHKHKGALQRVRLFQYETFTSIFGPNVATMAARVMIMLAVAGTLAIIAAGLLRPNAPQSTSARSSSIQVGAIAPDFTLTTPAGRQISLSNFRGKPVMLNFWYVTCPGCLAETPGMQKFYVSQHARGKNFVILGVNVVDDAQTAAQFMQQRGLTYPVVIDQNQHVWLCITSMLHQPPTSLTARGLSA